MHFRYQRTGNCSSRGVFKVLSIIVTGLGAGVTSAHGQMSTLLLQTSFIYSSTNLIEVAADRVANYSFSPAKAADLLTLCQKNKRNPDNMASLLFWFPPLRIVPSSYMRRKPRETDKKKLISSCREYSHLLDKEHDDFEYNERIFSLTHLYIENTQSFKSERQLDRVLSLEVKPRSLCQATSSKRGDSHSISRFLRTHRPILSLSREGNKWSNCYFCGESGYSPEQLATEVASVYPGIQIFESNLKNSFYRTRLRHSIISMSRKTGKGKATLCFDSLHGGKREHCLYRFPLSRVKAAYLNENGRGVAIISLLTPIDRTAEISSGWGWRIHPVLGGKRFHRGVDYRAPRGTRTLASADGVIESIGRRGNYGLYIRIRHSKVLSTAYAHLDKFAPNLKKGQSVRKGQLIGHVGTTGLATGPHLYYEILLDNRQVNPLNKNDHMVPIRLTAQEFIRFKRYVINVHQLNEHYSNN